MSTFLVGGGGVGPTVEIGEIDAVGVKGGLITYDTDEAVLTVGANGTVLTADSAAAKGIKWAAAATTTPAGADTQMQFNEAGAFGADPELVWDTSTKTLKVAKVASAGSVELQIYHDGSFQRIGALGSQMKFDTDSTNTRLQIGTENVSFRNLRCDVTVSRDLGTTGIRWRDLYIGRVLANDGTDMLPSVSFADDPDTGFFRATTDTIGIATAGAEKMRINADGQLLIGKTTASFSSPTRSIETENDGGTTLILHEVWGTGSVGLRMAKASGSKDTPGGLVDGNPIGVIEFLGSNSAGSTGTTSAQIACDADGTSTATAAPGRMEFWTHDGTSIVERMRIGSTGIITLGDGVNIAANATTGTKIGTATTQKFAFWNATPVVQQAHIADPAGGATVDAEARTAINSINALLATLGLTAAS